jgi:hypothetical protein
MPSLCAAHLFTHHQIRYSLRTALIAFAWVPESIASVGVGCRWIDAENDRRRQARIAWTRDMIDHEAWVGPAVVAQWRAELARLEAEDQAD